MATTLGAINIFRYRGYVYDADTELYYLQSRYYDPDCGRFLNPDDTSYLGESGTILGWNLYSYCENNAVNCLDITGKVMNKDYSGMGIKCRDDIHENKKVKEEIMINNLKKVKSWAIMRNYRSFANNHCGAVAITNLAVFYQYSYGMNALIDVRRGSRIDATFKKVHDKYGDGPYITIDGKVKWYFNLKSIKIKSAMIWSIDHAKSEIKKNHPVVFLISSGVDRWHWIVCVGYIDYGGGVVYFRVIDGWNDTINRFYRPHYGSSWISGRSFWI